MLPGGVPCQRPPDGPRSWPPASARQSGERRGQPRPACAARGPGVAMATPLCRPRPREAVAVWEAGGLLLSLRVASGGPTEAALTAGAGAGEPREARAPSAATVPPVATSEAARRLRPADGAVASLAASSCRPRCRALGRPPGTLAAVGPSPSPQPAGKGPRCPLRRASRGAPNKYSYIITGKIGLDWAQSH